MKKLKMLAVALLVGCSIMVVAAGCQKSPEQQFADDLKQIQNELQNELKNWQ